MKHLLSVLIYFLAGSGIHAWSGDKPAVSFGFELQAYPAGVVSGIKAEIGFNARNAFNFRLAYNLTERDDNGEHDDEEGGGPGGSVGFRHYFEDGLHGWFWGPRTDIWFLEIDWVDFVDRTAIGTTDITVLQPTLEVGYRFGSGGDGWSITPTIALGAEINIDTDGEDVGEGAILLGGIEVTYRF